MRIVFLKPKMIGDGLMLTPVLAAVRAAYPHAEIWVVVRRGCEGILAGCPAIDHIETIAAPFSDTRRRFAGWYDLCTLLRLRRQNFDLAFELGDGHRSRWFSLFIGAGKTYSVRPETPFKILARRWFDGVARFEWQSRHRVEKDFYTVGEFLALPDSPPPLDFAQGRTLPWPPAAALTDFAVIHPGTREPVKHWPREHWLAVGRHLLKRYAHIVISSGPRREEQADAAWLADRLGPCALNTRGTTSWAQLAWLLYRAKLFVGVDTAAMHLAAACQTPIVALFGPSIEENWRPWRANYRLVMAPLPADVVVPPGRDHRTQRRTTDIAVADVIAACDALAAEFDTASPPAPEPAAGHQPKMRSTNKRSHALINI